LKLEVKNQVGTLSVIRGSSVVVSEIKTNIEKVVAEMQHQPSSHKN
jgi:hypothetical protein